MKVNAIKFIATLFLFFVSTTPFAGDSIGPGLAIPAGHGIWSDNGCFMLAMLHDGNLVLYRQSDKKPIWASQTQGTGSSIVIMQNDGNLQKW